LIRNTVIAICLISAVYYLARDFIFFTFLYHGTRADWEIHEIQNECDDARYDFETARGSRGSPSDSAQSRQRLEGREAKLRERCLTLARENPDTQAELAAYYILASRWPKTQQGQNARMKLLELARSASVAQWGETFHQVHGRDVSLRPLAQALVQRVKESPEHPAGARLLAMASNLVAPDTDAEAAPDLYVEIADLIVNRHATSPDIANFIEHLGKGDDSPAWAAPFEPHLRRILSVNQDRFIRCTAKIALASLVQADNEMRQPEAEKLFEDFLAEFDGKVEYRASGIEAHYRQCALRQLASIRSHGLGKVAPATAGIDLDGRPMTLFEYRGKVVLVSFWATWCFPCMKLVEHEKQLVKRFDRDQFTILGVNSDTDLKAARTSVERHGITWRSLRNGDEGPGKISNQWHIVGYPTLYLLDREGIIRKRWIGNPPPQELESWIERLIAGTSGDRRSATKAGAPGDARSPVPAEGKYATIEVGSDSPAARGFIAKVYRSWSGDESKYCLFVPHQYDGRTPTPTILYLHGAGSVGTDGARQLNGALANAIKQREGRFPFLAIFPQAQEGPWQAGSRDGKRVMAILDEVAREYALDATRVYLTGISMGGEGTWSLAATYPERWAAIVPICGGGNPGTAARIKDIPCWCFHGDADRPDVSREMIRALQETGGRPLYHEFPGVGHNCWDQTYAMPELYEWMLAQRRLAGTSREP
jgi:pimeloyl-ACP methyl ester carboxylesterase/thiol-disulfide isomerase/thioredoxin